MEGSLARALYTFQATQPDELSVQEGDIIRVTQYINNHWLEAVHQGQTGLFPVSYAKRLESETHSLAEQWLYDNADISNHSSVKQCMNKSNESAVVEAAFGFDARNNSELTFPAGALIELERDVDDHWLEGSFNGKTGLFPKSYIKACSERPCAHAVYPFVGESTGELTFREGERIYLRKRLNSQWMEGEVNGNVGLFPSSFVAVEVDLPPDTSVDLRNGEYAASTSTHELTNRTNKTTKKIKWKEGMKGRALFHFTALYSGDLELNEGDIVMVMRIDDDNWIEGELENGISGSCPAAYLEPVIDNVASASKGRQSSSEVETWTFSNFAKSVWAFDSDTHCVNLQARDGGEEGSDVVDAYDHKTLLDSSFSEDFTPVLMPHNTNSLGNIYLTPRKPAAKPKPAVKAKPTRKYSVTYLGSENKSSGYMAGGNSIVSRPAVSMPSLLVDFSSNTASDSNSILESRTSPKDSSQHRECEVRRDKSSLSSCNGYDTAGTWPGKKAAIPRNSNVTLTERKEVTCKSEFDASDLLSGSCGLLPSPLIPLPQRERDDRQRDSSEGSPVVPRRPAPPPPRKNIGGSNDVRSRTLPVSHSKTLVEQEGISQAQEGGKQVVESKFSKPDIEIQETKANVTSPTYITRGPPPSSRGSAKSRVGSANKPKTLPRPTLVNLRREGVESGHSERKGQQDLKRSSSQEQLSAVKPCSQPQTDESAVLSHNDTDHSLEFDIPGLAKLDERIAETELNLQREMKVYSGMKIISQLIMTDPVKQREMEAKVSRSQQKIAEWQEELKHMKDEQAFLVESHRKKVLKVKIADLESDLEKQVRSQKSLETLLGVVDDTRKTEVMENLGTCAQEIKKVQMKLTELEASLHSLTEKPAASSQKHMAEQRRKVVTEVVNTERDYCNDLELCVKYFLFELKQFQLKELDCDSLFGNIENVLDTSRKLLKSLENAAQDDEGNGKDQELGKCFMDIADEIKEVYAVYCRNHDDAIALMEKYEEMPEIQDVFAKCLDKIREHTRCWDLSSFLIKPVQRVLKYPLLLNELLKYTPEIHRDKYNLLQATSMMTEVANAINEFKRRKDLVVKYKKVEDSGLTNMIQKLSWHSVVKKSSRFNQRLTQLTGLVSQTVDEKFIEEEKKFRGMEKTVKALWKNITTFLEEFQESALYQQLSGEYISEYYHEAATCSEVTIYQKVQNIVRGTILNRFMDCVQRQVLSPLTALLNLFQGPQRLIQKRHDKCLDYDRWSNKIDKIKDRDKLKAAKEELELAKKNYEALNTQLLEEIPGFTRKCMALMVDCLKNFAVAQRRLYHEIQQEYEQLLELPVVQNREGDIVEHHAKRSAQAVEQFSDLSFIPCSFVAKDSSRKKRKSQRFPALPLVDPNAVEGTDDTLNTKGDEPVERTKISPSPIPRSQRVGSDDPPRPRPVPRKQSSTPKQNPQDAYYPQRVEVTPGEGKMHIVEFTFESQNVGELSVSEGSQVAVLRHCDTSGNPEWWLVNWNGSTGYVPQSFLSPLDPTDKEITTAEDPEDGEISKEDNAGSSDEKPAENVYYYAEFVFEANSAAEVSLDEGQVVVVLQKHDLLGNDEWWLVDADGEKGYVPACYLTPVEE